VNPVAVISHLVAVVAGVWIGLGLMGEIAPDLPDPGVQPGLSAPGDPEEVAGGDPDSLLREENLGPALDDLAEQLGADGHLLRLRIEAGRVAATEGEDGYDLADVPPSGPEELVDLIAGERPKVGIDDVDSVELVQTRDGPRWHVQLVSTGPDLPPPWTYGAPFGFEGLTVGGAPPRQLGE